MPAKATLSCPDGCFTVTYRATIDTDDVDDADFLNELGPPTAVQRNTDRCPNCDADVTVDWEETDAN